MYQFNTEFVNYSFRIEKHLFNLHFAPKANFSSRDAFLPAELIADNLVKHTSVATLRFNTINRMFYVFVSEYNYYLEVNQMTLHAMVSKLLNKLIREVRMERFQYVIFNYSLIESIVIEFKSHYLLHITIRNMNSRFLAFCNGSLDLVSLKKLPRKIRVFTTSFIPSDFLFEQRHLSNGDIGFFKHFLETVFKKNMEFIFFIRAMLKRALVPMSPQKIIFFIGMGSTGKSALTHVLVRCLGENNVLTTTLDQLRDNAFERSLLANKKLLLFNDISFKSESDIQFLLALSGGDLSPARMKYSMDEIKINFSGLILIVGNQIPVINDPMKAFSRRLIIIPFENRISAAAREVLLSKLPSGALTGPLAAEIANILNWALSCPNDILDLFFNTNYSGKNIVLLGDKYYFIKLFILCYLEYTTNENDFISTNLKGSNEASLGLWPMFINFSQEQNLNLKELGIKAYDFLNDFQTCLTDFGWSKCFRKRMTNGYCYTYLKFHDIPNSIESAYQKIKQMENGSEQNIVPMDYIKARYPNEKGDWFYAFSENLRYFKPIEVVHLASQSMDLLTTSGSQDNEPDNETISYFEHTTGLIQDAELALQTQDKDRRQQLFESIEVVKSPKINQLLPLIENDKSINENDKPIKRKRGRPKKNLLENDKSDKLIDQSIPKRRRGRPKKNLLENNKENH